MLIFNTLPRKIVLKKLAYINYFFAPLYLIIRYLSMNKDKKIERLERQLAKLREENRQLKSDVRKAKKDSSNENKKKTSGE